ncbi:MAG: alkaline phosphatase [Alphaproteobacteria bacterium HGW-Alphaproteobacteria-15]|nr:MAG: alkaline phosphatase [Alphaproteobacteria bacterium HGW-Alphaproteobacteria-15]
MLISRRAAVQSGLLLSGLGLLPASLRAANNSGFTHSVASGDPDLSSVRVWTRFVSKQAVTLQVEMAESESFASPVFRGTVDATPARDFCAQMRVHGLQPDRWYYYRFLAPDGTSSPTGRTRTLPGSGVERLRMAMMSCANATSGWFSAYAHAAMRDDLDLIVHLGDYIYESPINRSDALEELAIRRGIMPHGEVISLLDYRMRYASYRADPALQELHRRHPMIVIWDDHETANNSWKDGAKNHDPEEGPWEVRKSAAMQAFYEWLPMEALPYTSYKIGSLATLFRLETRLVARSQQLEIGAEVMNMPDPRAAIKAFVKGPLADPSRTLLGPEQEAWLARGFMEAGDQQSRWQVLLQPVIMANTQHPKIDAGWFAGGAELSSAQQQQIALADFLAANGVPLGLDRWNGYPAARNRLLSSAQRAGSNLLVLSGDSHNAWAFDLTHEGQAAGVEFAGQGVSSLGIDKRFSGDPAHIAQGFLSTDPALRWCDTSQRGYMEVELTNAAAQCKWIFLPSRDQISTEVLSMHTMIAEHGARRFS